MGPSTQSHSLFYSVRFSDWVTVTFSLLFGFIALFNISGASQNLASLSVMYFSFAIFQLCLVVLSKRGGFFRLCRDMVFPLVAVFSLFDSLTVLIPEVNPKDLDYLLIKLDYFLFGTYPTVFFEGLQHPILSDVLQFCYSLYYFLPLALGVSLKLKGYDDAFERGLASVLLCFYLSYIGYLLVPALGPRYTMEHLHSSFIADGLISGPIRDLLNYLEGIKRDAFPSGHTGISLLVLLLSWRYSRGLFIPFLIVTIGILLATVYFRYHYVIDLIGGVALTVVTISVSEVYYRFSKKQ